jgi:hypothetical protein
LVWLPHSWEGPEEEGIDGGEDGRVEPDSEGEGEDDDEGEDWVLHQYSPGISEVPEERRHGILSPGAR